MAGRGAARCQGPWSSSRPNIRLTRLTFPWARPTKTTAVLGSPVRGSPAFKATGRSADPQILAALSGADVVITASRLGQPTADHVAECEDHDVERLRRRGSSRRRPLRFPPPWRRSGPRSRRRCRRRTPSSLSAVSIRTRIRPPGSTARWPRRSRSTTRPRSWRAVHRPVRVSPPPPCAWPAAPAPGEEPGSCLGSPLARSVVSSYDRRRKGACRALSRRKPWAMTGSWPPRARRPSSDEQLISKYGNPEDGAVMRIVP